MTDFSVDFNAFQTGEIGSGAFYIYPPYSIGGSIHDTLRGDMNPEKDVGIACTSGELSEDYVIRLPKSAKILSIPDDLKINNDVLRYTASYRLKGNVLTVKRTLEDRTKGNVCSPAFMADYKKVAEKIMDNVKEQVLYK